MKCTFEFADGENDIKNYLETMRRTRAWDGMDFVCFRLPVGHGYEVYRNGELFCKYADYEELETFLSGELGI